MAGDERRKAVETAKAESIGTDRMRMKNLH
jgi:hypothetical protein